MSNHDSGQKFSPFGFLRMHIFECIAAALTFIGIFAYGLGMSFYEGWSQMAGIPGSYFQFTVQEVIRKGLSVPGPWILTGGAITATLVYILVNMLWDVWARQRNLNRRRRDAVKAAKSDRIQSGFGNRKARKAYQAWKQLGPRGSAIKAPVTQPKARALRRKAVRIGILWAFAPLLSFAIIVGFCKFLHVFFVDAAVREGRAEYLGIYAAVTGKFPPSLPEHERSRARRQELACAAAKEMWKYRAVTLMSRDRQSGTPAYLLQATGNIFLLLTSTGSILKAFGDDGFELAKSSDRPVSKLLDSCGD